MYKALIIGCGNIGALYDFDLDSVSTYAKAFHLDPEIEFEVFDINKETAQKVAERYGVRRLEGLKRADYINYDIVAICTPTETHHEYLSQMLDKGPKLVICEKPVDVDKSRLARLKELYRHSGKKVMVNYFRRFQPGIIRLKSEIETILKKEGCTNIVVKYQRGFHNNASHAVDLLEFLFGSTIDLSNAKLGHKVFDEFDSDPTVCTSSDWNGANVQFVGLSNVKFSRFELEIYFSERAVILKDGGDEIELYSTEAKSGNFHPRLALVEIKTGVIKNYMENVVSHAKRLVDIKEAPDNFLESVSVSERILNLTGG
jgi:predicted dehydrogenase